jgi:hypothetical protein
VTAATENTLLQNITTNVNPQAISIALEYQALIPLGDLGLELRRQNAVFWLLQNGYYTDAQNVINQFQNLSNVQNAVIAVPIPTQVVIPANTSSSGQIETLQPSNAPVAS